VETVVAVRECYRELLISLLWNYFCWYIEPGTSGRENVQDTVEQPAGVTSRSADVRLRLREVFPDNLPEIIVDFPEKPVPEYYLRGPIIWDNLVYNNKIW
jgi:hypothetical protein